MLKVLILLTTHHCMTTFGPVNQHAKKPKIRWLTGEIMIYRLELKSNKRWCKRWKMRDHLNLEWNLWILCRLIERKMKKWDNTGRWDMQWRIKSKVTTPNAFLLLKLKQRRRSVLTLGLPFVLNGKDIQKFQLQLLKLTKNWELKDVMN